VSHAVEHLSRDELLARVAGEPEALLRSLDDTVYVVDGFHPAERVRRFRAMAEAFAAGRPPAWHACLDGVPDFHRIVDEYPGAWIRSRMHAFVFHRFNGNAALFDEFRDVFRIKARLAGADEAAFLEAVPSDGVIARVASNQYPRGGGYLAEHRDPTSPYARLQTIVQASDPGEDFTEGGLYVRDDDGGAPVMIDPHSRMGDLLVLSPHVRHGVAPIDPDAELDWSTANGRWMILPILVVSDYDTDRAKRPRQVG
jgi:hypothetical protein